MDAVPLGSGLLHARHPPAGSISRQAAAALPFPGEEISCFPESASKVSSGSVRGASLQQRPGALTRPRAGPPLRVTSPAWARAVPASVGRRQCLLGSR